MKSAKKVDWSRFGLAADDASETAETTRLKDPALEGGFYGGQEEELFAEEKGEKPWWQSNFFVRERILFGTWDGVFTSCLVNLLGVIVFLRSGWVVAEAGVAMATLIVVVSVVIVLTSVLSAVGICERSHIESGGVHFLVSHVLGAQIGSAVGLVYCFGQAVGISLCVAGFGESMAELIGLQEWAWSDRAFGAAALLLLSFVNLAGVKWVVKVQLLLLLPVLLALGDFLVGSVIVNAEDSGIPGWSAEIWKNNTGPQYTEGTTWFTVLGVFFPTVTGIMAGINMSGDLRNPSKDIPVGTLTALIVGTMFYLLFIIVLGATVERDILLNDYLITEKVSALGGFLLAGLYTSTLSVILASLYGTPRVLQSIAAQMPLLSILAKGKGPNKEPIAALLLIVFINLAFLFVGPINTLAPIVTMPFLATYSVIDYAYFVLAMSFDMKGTKASCIRTQSSSSFLARLTRGSDLDHLFPERITHKKVITSAASSGSSSGATSPRDEKGSSIRSQSFDEQSETFEVHKDPEDFFHKDLIAGLGQASYSSLSSCWVSLVGALLKVILMVCVQWMYALATFATIGILYISFGKTSPGLPPGVASQFRLIQWINNFFQRCFGRLSNDEDQVIVPPIHPGVQVSASQLTQENKDYAARSRYHHSVPGDPFPDPR